MPVPIRSIGAGFIRIRHKDPNWSNCMKEATKRALFRWTHIGLVLTLVGYIYGPPDETRPYLSFFRYVYFPIVLVSGFWMWKGPAVMRLVSRRPR